ncbi:DUF2750 domain-containing protein [Psychromonas hadalis]|uniref:DUF2750 domain-containing protein n=1 Tax=Psychromonas hadalis TaxID=211669 RepID=UPI0003B42CB8|nr:DUF2750 domain-containing protein [Psychromonas hadalis]
MKELYLKNAEKFVDDVCESLTLYGLFDEKEGWANCHAHDNNDAQAVYLFWSDEKTAKKLQNAEWKNYKITPIELSVFLDSWLDGMQSKQVFAGVNWDEELYGLEIEAMVLKNSLLEKSQILSKTEDKTAH